MNLSCVVEGMQKYVLTALSDITAKKQSDQELSILGIRDELTGLYTRRYTLKKLDELIQLSWPEAYPLSVALIKIDAEQSSTDEIRKSLATVLREHARSSDIVGRYDEDEFMAIFTKLDTEYARNILADMLAGFREKTKRDNGTMQSFSSGMISAGSVAGSICDIKDYIHDTEVMLEKAQKNGGNRIEAENESY